MRRIFERTICAELSERFSELVDLVARGVNPCEKQGKKLSALFSSLLLLSHSGLRLSNLPGLWQGPLWSDGKP
jgi:hypothetical protein